MLIVITEQILDSTHSCLNSNIVKVTWSLVLGKHLFISQFQIMSQSHCVGFKCDFVACRCLIGRGFNFHNNCSQ